MTESNEPITSAEAGLLLGLISNQYADYVENPSHYFHSVAEKLKAIKKVAEPLL